VSTREAFLEVARALQPDELVPMPARLVIAFLGGSSVADAPSADPLPPADLTCAQVAERLGRAPSTVRAWIAAGRLRAYLFQGKEHRITLQALQEFEKGQREGGAQTPSPARGSRKPDLSAWRRDAG
jgi:excisionase family DNA binding protein